MSKYEKDFPELVDPAVEALIDRLAELLEIQVTSPIEDFIDLLKLKLEKYFIEDLDTSIAALGIRRKWNIWYLEFPTNKELYMKLLVSVNNFSNTKSKKELTLDEVYNFQNFRRPQFESKVKSHFSQIGELLKAAHTEDRKLLRKLAYQLEEEVQQLLGTTASIRLEQLIVDCAKLWVKIVNPYHELNGEKIFISRVIARLGNFPATNRRSPISTNIDSEDFILEITPTLSPDRQNYIKVLSDRNNATNLASELADEFNALMIQLRELPKALAYHSRDIHTFHQGSGTSRTSFVDTKNIDSKLSHSCPAMAPMQKLFHYIWQNFTYDEASQSLVKRAVPIEMHVAEETTTET
ncbi:MAG: hypothetical protein JNK26_01575 [Candidatus Doudnabacteria bacterium]|nr:hypothetical protein [Candidatus Doudnabacteria bacterium]